MKNKLFLAVLALFATVSTVSARVVLKVEGDESRYNQITVFNETSQTNFSCRIVLLDENEEIKSVYSVYNLKENGDRDTHVSWVRRGDILGIELPADFPVEFNAEIGYRDYPLYDIIEIHLTDKTTEFK